jgi:hypothetical protein
VPHSTIEKNNFGTSKYSRAADPGQEKKVSMKLHVLLEIVRLCKERSVSNTIHSYQTFVSLLAMQSCSHGRWTHHSKRSQQSPHWSCASASSTGAKDTGLGVAEKVKTFSSSRPNENIGNTDIPMQPSPTGAKVIRMLRV